MPDLSELRKRLVDIALEWQEALGVSPAITSAVSEVDAAIISGCIAEDIRAQGENRTAVTKGHDFICDGVTFQVKANRPSGKKGSRVTLVAKPKNYEWDKLIWILYDQRYQIVEAYEWDVQPFYEKFDSKKRLSPNDLQEGKRLIIPSSLPSARATP